jgi:hypothetical protein
MADCGKTRPTQGDWVLIREMAPNQTEIAHQDSQHALNPEVDNQSTGSDNQSDWRDASAPLAISGSDLIIPPISEPLQFDFHQRGADREYDSTSQSPHSRSDIGSVIGAVTTSEAKNVGSYHEHVSKVVSGRAHRGNLSKEASSTLNAWFGDHRANPYPTEDQKMELCQMTDLTMNQVCCLPLTNQQLRAYTAPASVDYHFGNM